MEQIGIVSYGAHIPRYRIKAEVIAAVWGKDGQAITRGLGIFEKLETQGCTLYDHWKPGLTREESMSLRKDQSSCDIYLTSANAITLNGEIVNTDGSCNRTSAMGFGPQQVIILAGWNKIVKDLDEALKRVRNVATPMNAKRLGSKTPCFLTGICAEDKCQLPESCAT
jgi:hypothetical protein